MVYWEERNTLLVLGSPLMADANQNASTGVPQPNFVDLTAGIVAAYVVKNAVQRADLPSLIATVHSALSEAARGDGTAAGRTAPCGADQEISYTRFPDLPGRWSEVQKS
jgi:hypothetical protein